MQSGDGIPQQHRPTVSTVEELSDVGQQNLHLQGCLLQKIQQKKLCAQEHRDRNRGVKLPEREGHHQRKNAAQQRQAACTVDQGNMKGRGKAAG